jgi:hypothetical protein
MPAQERPIGHGVSEVVAVGVGCPFAPSSRTLDAAGIRVDAKEQTGGFGGLVAIAVAVGLAHQRDQRRRALQRGCAIETPEIQQRTELLLLSGEHRLDRAVTHHDFERGA